MGDGLRVDSTNYSVGSFSNQDKEPPSKVSRVARESFALAVSTGFKSESEITSPLLKSARTIQSDKPWVRKITDLGTAILNLKIGNSRPLLSFIALFPTKWGKGSREYLKASRAIRELPKQEKRKIRNNTKVYGGEEQWHFRDVQKKYQEWRKDSGKTEESAVGVHFHSETDSLGAARDYKEMHPNAKIAIMNFANAVHVGGANDQGRPGTQEENLMRTTYLEVSLKGVKNSAKSRAEFDSHTGRYIPFFSAIVSKDVATIPKEGVPEGEAFGYVSAAAPDLRSNIFRSEGTALRKGSPEDLEEIIFRKLLIVAMAAAQEGYDTLVLGDWGGGAFQNDPAVMAKMMRRLQEHPLVRGVIKEIIFPIHRLHPHFSAYVKAFF